jgi:hypothetical protein
MLAPNTIIGPRMVTLEDAVSRVCKDYIAGALTPDWADWVLAPKRVTLG